VYKLHKKTTKKLAKIAGDYGIFTRKKANGQTYFRRKKTVAFAFFSC
jgi:hypothetical protein